MNFIKSKFTTTKRFLSNINSLYLNFRPFIWFIFVNEFLFDFYLLEGESMIPTFKEFGDVVIVEKLTTSKLFHKIFRKSGEFRKGEIVCLINPIENDVKICKRIIHLENEIVKFKNGNEILVPKNHVWVEGDNKDNSMDSRKFGPVSKHLIVGRIRYQLWPKLTILKYNY